MLNIDQLNESIKSGSSKMDTLTEDEVAILQAYGLMLVRSLYVQGSKAGAGVTDISLNAFRNGFALGIQTAIDSGMIKKRSAA